MPMTWGSLCLAPESMPTPSHHESIRVSAPSISTLPVPSTTQPPPLAENPLFNLPTQSMIAEEDPQRSIEISKDDEDDKATGVR